MATNTQSMRRFVLLRNGVTNNMPCLCRQPRQPLPNSFNGLTILTQEEVLQRIGQDKHENFIILDIYDQKKVVTTKAIK